MGVEARAIPNHRPAGSRRPRNRELGRKAIHIATVLAPILAWVLPRPATISILGSAVIVAIAVEVARARIRWVRYRFLSATRGLLRPHERNRPAGATYLALSYFLAAVFFPRPIAVAAMLYSGLGDAAAALVGKRWGRHRIRSGKSWEGAGAGLAVNLAAGLAVPGIPLLAVIAGGTVAATLELLPIPVDDNLRVTLGGGLAGWGAWLLVGLAGAA